MDHFAESEDESGQQSEDESGQHGLARSSAKSDPVADLEAGTALVALIVEAEAEAGDGAIAEAVRRSGRDVRSVRVDSEDRLCRALGERAWDIVLAGHDGAAGVDARVTLDILQRSGLAIPVIVISAVRGEEVAVEMLQRGADDYLLATSLDKLSAAIGQAMVRADERRGRRVGDQLMRLVCDHSHDLIVLCDTEGRFLTVNAAVSAMLGYQPEQLIGERFDKIVYSEDLAAMEEEFAALAARESVSRVECRYVHKSGEIRHLVWSVAFAPAGVFIAIGRDVTERLRAEEMVRQERDYADAVLNTLPGVFFHVGSDRLLVRWNSNLERITGYTQSELSQIDSVEFTAEEDRDLVVERIGEIFTRGEARVETHLALKDGRRIPYLFTATPFEHDGELGYVGVGTDLTELRNMEEALRAETAMFEGVVAHAPDGIVVTDIDGRRIIQNTRLSELLALTPEVENDADPQRQLAYIARKMVDPDGFTAKANWLLEHPTEQARDEVELLDGTVLDRLSGPIVDDEGHYYGRIWSYRDISDRRQVERTLRYLATHDDLTGLANRALVEDRIEQLTVDPRRAGRQFALLYVDLDRFKVVNDGYGHPFGDVLLKAVGELLVSVVPDEGVVARHGGDEFLILLPQIAGPDDAGEVAQNVVDNLATPFLIRGREVYLSGSIGVSLFPDHGRTAHALIGNADVAMFHSKEEGRNTVRFYTREMGERSLQRVDLESALRGAAAAGQLRLVYQPKVTLANARVVGCEALVRWVHPELGLVLPDRFIPIAEESGLIVPIADWVLHEACRQAKAWLESGLPAVSVAVNVSARQVHDQDVVACVMRTLDETGLPPTLLELELTENLITRDAEAVVATVDGLRAAGVRIAIDDFGTGYSALSDLRRFRVDTLKIDKSFVRSMLTEPDDATIVRAVISLAHNLGITVVAEGVETEEQGTFLRRAGCDQAQGYFFGRPVPAEDFEALLRESSVPLPRC